MNQRCALCQNHVTDQDFNNTNFVIDQSGVLVHSTCPQNQLVSYGLWTKQFVSTQSQYSHQSAGSCTINALETAVRLQIGEEPSVSLINDVLVLASLYTSSMHTGVLDVLPHVARYRSVLKSIHWEQCNVQNINMLIDTLKRNTKSSRHDVSCVITKPPESIFVHCYYDTGQYVLYDSHPRPNKTLNGSHFLVFSSCDMLKLYLSVLFPFVDLGRGNYGLHGDMMNQCEGHYLQIDHNKWKDMKKLKEQVVTNIDYEAMNKDLSVIGFELQTQFLNAPRAVRNQKINDNHDAKTIVLAILRETIVSAIRREKTDANGNEIEDINVVSALVDLHQATDANKQKQTMNHNKGDAQISHVDSGDVNELKDTTANVGNNNANTEPQHIQNNAENMMGIMDGNNKTEHSEDDNNSSSNKLSETGTDNINQKEVIQVGNVSGLDRENTGEFVHVDMGQSSGSTDFIKVSHEEEQMDTHEESKTRKRKRTGKRGKKKNKRVDQNEAKENDISQEQITEQVHGDDHVNDNEDVDIQIVD